MSEVPAHVRAQQQAAVYPPPLIRQSVVTLAAIDPPVALVAPCDHDAPGAGNEALAVPLAPAAFGHRLKVALQVRPAAAAPLDAAVGAEAIRADRAGDVVAKEFLI